MGLLQVLFDAAVGHAERGENMAYAVYVAAKLQRPDDVCRLWAGLQTCVQSMSLRDLFNVLWAGARLGLGEKLNLDPALGRLEQLLVSSQQDSTAGDSTTSAELDPFLASACASQSERSAQAQRADGCPQGVPGWLVAQIAWSLAELKVDVKPALAENLFKAVR